MKKQLFSIALCSSISLCAAVDENFALENLGQICAQSQMQAMFDQAVLMLRKFQDIACTEATLDQVKELIAEQLEPLCNIPNDNTPEAYMLRQTLALFKEALKAVAEITRKNQLPAVDTQTLRKGVDVQATRLKVVEYVESLLK